VTLHLRDGIESGLLGSSRTELMSMPLELWHDTQQTQGGDLTSAAVPNRRRVRNSAAWKDSAPGASTRSACVLLGQRGHPHCRGHPAGRQRFRLPGEPTVPITVPLREPQGRRFTVRAATGSD